MWHADFEREKIMMTYNILSARDAQDTLQKLTYIPWAEWQEIHNRYNYFRDGYEDEYIDKILGEKCVNLPYFEDLRFIFSHVSTSANSCNDIKTLGLIRYAYLNSQTELYSFLNENGITIELSKSKLHYHSKTIDISFGDCPPEYEEEKYAAWSVGRKVYYDYCVCGFLSYSSSAYLGYVHKRPEILMDIDNLLKTNLSDQWEKTHQAYEVIAQVDAKKIVYEGDKEQDEHQKVLNYLMKAYWCAFSDEENIILLQNDMEILPADILEIRPFDRW